jgi:sulfur carrier protein
MGENSKRRINITLNGEPYALGPGTSVAALVEVLKMRPARVAVEINREVVPTARYAATEIHAGDQVEIINFVGGG